MNFNFKLICFFTKYFICILKTYLEDTMKDTLTQEQIDDGYVVIDGVKPRSKYIKIEITNHKLSLGL